jgi:hypothetical protein
MPDFVKIKQVISPAETGVSQNRGNCQSPISQIPYCIFFMLLV